MGAGGDRSRVPSEAAIRDVKVRKVRHGAMFVGVHERQLDEKGRLALPAAYRSFVGDSCYLVLGEDRCVDVLARDEFERVAREIMDQVRRGEATRNRQRAFAHSATLVTLDKQGRITIGDELRSYARLEPGSRVVVSGNLDRAELWSAELYDRVSASGRGEMAGGTE